jgi:glutamyl-tRNA synthetase
LPEALLNFLVRLGWSHGDQEIFSIQEMMELFDPKDINKSASSYNLDKLLWLNSHYIKECNNARLITLLQDFGINLQDDSRRDLILKATKERAKTLVDLSHQIRLLIENPKEYDDKALKKAYKEDTASILNDFIGALKNGNPQSKEAFHDLLQDFVAQKEIGFGKIAQPLRLALMGELSGAGLDEIMEIVGMDEVVKRIENLISHAS